MQSIHTTFELDTNTKLNYGHTFIPNVCRRSGGVVTVACDGMGDMSGGKAGADG